ncbi:hypothetical protein [Streptomyces sp. NPDC058665]|uniref:hypothetical protein n=1 Tax=Streptomyces sp. NPDC058665 TaxID=3346586 RepID=UPI00364CE1D1
MIALLLVLVVAAVGWATVSGADPAWVLGITTVLAVAGVAAMAWMELVDEHRDRGRVTQDGRPAARVPERLSLTRALAWWLAGRLWSSARTPARPAPDPLVRPEAPPSWAVTQTAPHHHRGDTPP